jgi:integrase
MENTRLCERASTSANVTVGRRSREYLTEREVERLIEAAKQNRSGHRDATAILVAYRHGLRASELVALRWDDVDLATGRMHVHRARAATAACIRYRLAKVERCADYGAKHQRHHTSSSRNAARRCL